MEIGSRPVKHWTMEGRIELDQDNNDRKGGRSARHRKYLNEYNKERAEYQNHKDHKDHKECKKHKKHKEHEEHKDHKECEKHKKHKEHKEHKEHNKQKYKGRNRGSYFRFLLGLGNGVLGFLNASALHQIEAKRRSDAATELVNVNQSLVNVNQTLKSALKETVSTTGTINEQLNKALQKASETIKSMRQSQQVESAITKKLTADLKELTETVHANQFSILGLHKKVMILFGVLVFCGAYKYMKYNKEEEDKKSKNKKTMLEYVAELLVKDWSNKDNKDN